LGVKKLLPCGSGRPTGALRPDGRPGGRPPPDRFAGLPLRPGWLGRRAPCCGREFRLEELPRDGLPRGGLFRDTVALVLVVTRFIVPESEAATFAARAERAVAALSARPGFRSARVGQAPDDEQRWVLVSEWEGVGAWRRALSAFDVRVEAVPLLAMAEDEPGAYEVRHALDNG
jgi:heme oxygenase (mycobilin-producing)